MARSLHSCATRSADAGYSGPAGTPSGRRTRRSRMRSPDPNSGWLDSARRRGGCATSCLVTGVANHGGKLRRKMLIPVDPVMSLMTWWIWTFISVKAFCMRTATMPSIDVYDYRNLRGRCIGRAAVRDSSARSRLRNNSGYREGLAASRSTIIKQTFRWDANR